MECRRRRNRPFSHVPSESLDTIGAAQVCQTTGVIAKESFCLVRVHFERSSSARAAKTSRGKRTRQQPQKQGLRGRLYFLKSFRRASEDHSDSIEMRQPRGRRGQVVPL